MEYFFIYKTVNAEEYYYQKEKFCLLVISCWPCQSLKDIIIKVVAWIAPKHTQFIKHATFKFFKWTAFRFFFYY